MHTEPSRPAFDLDRFQDLARRAELTPGRCEWPAELGSTNAELADRLTAEPDGWPDLSVLGTDHQTAGRGRLDRVWTVPPAACLTFSVPFRVPAAFPAEMLGWLPVVTGWCVAEALAERGAPAGVKWPNDVLVDGRKICGILTRAHLDPERGTTVIIGIGINVSLTAGELPVPTATSLTLAGGSADREALLVGVLSRLGPAVAEVLRAGPRAGATAPAGGVRDAMITLGSDVRVELPGDERFTGRAVELDATAAIVVEVDGERRRVSAGDVVHARPA